MTARNKTGAGSPSVVILGGGLFGLKAAYDLAQRGASVCLVEKEASVGGLCRSFTFGDLTFDTGPHLFYTGFEQERRDIHDEYTRLLGYSPVSLGNRIAQSLMLTRSEHCTYHPLRVAHVLSRFGPRFAAQVAVDIARNRLQPHQRQPQNARELLTASFGPALFEEAFAPYMRKSCGIAPEEVDTRWVTERDYVLGKKGIVPLIISSMQRRRQSASGHVYPAHGGAQAIPDAYAHALRELGVEILLDTRVTRLDADSESIRVVHVEGPDGERPLRGDSIISSLPLPDLSRMLRPAADPAVLQAADALAFRKLILVFSKYHRPELRDTPQVYLGTDSIHSKRLSEPKQLCAALAPTGETGLCWEVCCDETDPLWEASDADLFELAQRDLSATKLESAPPARMEGVAVRRIQHAYPVYRRGFDAHRATLLDHIGRFRNLTSGGRQGQFKYNIYTNQTWELAAEAARRTLSDD